MDYLGSKYTGDRKNGRLEGAGEYTFATGTIYKGQLKDGMFHGHGTLHFPNGCKCEAQWENGRVSDRDYTFTDGLKFKEHDWSYCTTNDRRFYTEICTGLQPAGRSLLTDKAVAMEIPAGCYDTGDGFYNQQTKVVTNYDNAFLRNADADEQVWIEKHCRKGWDKFVGFQDTDTCI
ncbi:PREDICTED: MORN repeat-containing protein 5-like isoform X2 [Priapulus caudatus]|uniref:MORN repeat-containing protein 5 n=1 Tax=Priapulus caudatus TaxID=37621 RepID=A0ABM1EKE6_PRICU|nr:PREDICTED: MORN repeat-containing protein 5-like isoform X2 [Priapulus caudatus]